MPIRFDRFVLDSEARELRSDRGPLHLSPKALQLLEALIESRPKALSKAALRDRLWPGTFVVDANLANLVAEIRAVLGETRQRPRFIRTVHGFGYAFREDPGASEKPARTSGRKPPAQWLVCDDKIIALRQGANILGRGEDASVRVLFPGVSRRHARILVDERGATIEDLGSKNGTFLREQPVESKERLTDGDTLRLGSRRLVFRSSGDGSTLSEVYRRSDEQ